MIDVQCGELASQTKPAQAGQRMQQNHRIAAAGQCDAESPTERQARAEKARESLLNLRACGHRRKLRAAPAP